MFVVGERVPVEAGVAHSLRIWPPSLIHPLRFLAAEDGDPVPKFGQAGEIWQDLRPPERIGQAVIGDVQDLGGHGASHMVKRRSGKLPTLHEQFPNDQRADQIMSRHLAFLLPDMGGGGAERVALTLIKSFVARGYRVDLLLMSASGALLPLVPPEVEIIDLGVERVRGVIGPLANIWRVRGPPPAHLDVAVDGRRRDRGHGQQVGYADHRR